MPRSSKGSADFDFADSTELTVLQPSLVTNYCYLYEALLWVAVQRFPLFQESESGVDIRTDLEDVEDFDPRFEFDVLNDDECRHVGLPENPEYALLMEGDYCSRPDFYEQMLAHEQEPKYRQKLESELLVATAHYKRVDAWDEQFQQFLDLLRIPTIATTHSGRSRPPVPIDRDQCGAGARSAAGCSR